MRKLIIPVIILFVLVSIAGINQAEAAGKSDGKMAGSAGLGITYPMGDMGDAIKFPMIPLLLSFQYAVMPFLTAEADAYYFLYAEPDVGDADITLYQLGVGMRYWLSTKWKQGKAYDGIYFGGGLARTTFEAGDYDESDMTLVLKGGYIYQMKPVLLDFGARYDGIEMKDWMDKIFTVYAMATYVF